MAAFIDVEHALDPGYARACGVNVDELLVSQPDTGEQALEITETLIRSGGIDCVVVDSVAALVPRAEIEGEMGDSFVGIQARLMSQALRKLTGAVSRSNTSLVFTNQLREKIGVMFGNPETTPGGRALKFYASVRLDIRRIETIKTGTESVGNRVRVKVVKNKVAPPFRVAEFDVMYGEGISKEGGLLDVGVAMDVVNKTGAWFTFDETRLGQGREASKEFLKREPGDRRRDRAPHPRPDRRGRASRSRASKRPSDRRLGAPLGGRAATAALAASRTPSAGHAGPRSTIRRSCSPRRCASSRRGRAPSHETRRRLTDAGYRPELVEGAIDAAARARAARRRGVRPALGRVARPGPAARRDRPQARAAAARHRRSRGRGGPRRAPAGSGGRRSEAGRPRTIAGRSAVDPDEAAARRLLDRRRRDLERVADPRKRRARAYALLARNGFDPEIASRLQRLHCVAPDDRPRTAVSGALVG